MKEAYVQGPVIRDQRHIAIIKTLAREDAAIGLGVGWLLIMDMATGSAVIRIKSAVVPMRVVRVGCQAMVVAAKLDLLCHSSLFYKQVGFIGPTCRYDNLGYSDAFYE